MRVRVVPAGSSGDWTGPVPGAAGTQARLDRPGWPGWRPRAVLGAPAPGGLLLPPAHPTAAWLYGPRGVWVDDDLVIVADTGNHRVLIWYGVPEQDGVPADVVLGQTDEVTEGPAAGGTGPANGMHMPCGVLRDGDQLVVADAWHHRLLVWQSLPTRTGTPPDHVLGQGDPESVEPNAGGEPDAGSFYWPFGIALIGGRLHVADTGNRRVLIWNDGIPEPGEPADVVLGQADARSREENRGGPAAADSFRWPHAFASGGPGGAALWVADAGNHRVLGWRTPPERDTPADLVLGQADFTTATEFPYVSQFERLRFPYAIASGAGDLAIADTANNRVLLQPGGLDTLHPRIALGQGDLVANGENRWTEVAADTLCWPYGLHWHRRGERTGLLAVADSGNNRVVLWAEEGP